jgi:hypothetical protein
VQRIDRIDGHEVPLAPAAAGTGDRTELHGDNT